MLVGVWVGCLSYSTFFSPYSFFPHPRTVLGARHEGWRISSLSNRRWNIFYPFPCCVTHVGGKRDQGHYSECKVLTNVAFFPPQMRNRTRGRQKQPKQKKDRSPQMSQSWCITMSLSISTMDILNWKDTG